MSLTLPCHTKQQVKEKVCPLKEIGIFPKIAPKFGKVFVETLRGVHAFTHLTCSEL